MSYSWTWKIGDVLLQPDGQVFLILDVYMGGHDDWQDDVHVLWLQENTNFWISRYEMRSRGWKAAFG